MELRYYMKKNIRPKLYTLSTCVHCRATKRFLKEHNIDYDYVDVDMLNGKERDKIRKDVMKLSGGRFPTIVVGKKVLVGFEKDKLVKALGL
jgi:glutaredoxin-like protein NrdH